MKTLDRNMGDLEEPIVQEDEVLPSEVAKGLVSGTSTLGLGVLIERSCGFLANILAARFGGAQTFGAYALAISTANNVSTYAAGGSAPPRFASPGNSASARPAIRP